MSSLYNRAITDAGTSLVKLQQQTVDALLEILEEGSSLGHEIAFRDDTQRARVRSIRDQMHPAGVWAKRLQQEPNAMPAARSKPTTHRDTTRALVIVKHALKQLARAERILTDIDARGSRRDPHLRRKT